MPQVLLHAHSVPKHAYSTCTEHISTEPSLRNPKLLCNTVYFRKHMHNQHQKCQNSAKESKICSDTGQETQKQPILEKPIINSVRVIKCCSCSLSYPSCQQLLSVEQLLLISNLQSSRSFKFFSWQHCAGKVQPCHAVPSHCRGLDC